jgi:hypothetical protein
MDEKMEKILATAKTLVAVREEDEFRVYDSELWREWNKSEKQLIFGPTRVEECEAGHYVAKVFRTDRGYWLVKSWIPHFGYHWDEGRVYFLGPHLPV